MSSILESSNNVQLLIAAVQIVGSWLMTRNGSGPLTRMERLGFLSKLSGLDSRAIGSIQGQALADVVGHTILTMCEEHSWTLVNMEGESSFHYSDFAVSNSIEDVFNKCFITCLLNANRSIRKRAIELFETFLKKLNGPDHEKKKYSRIYSVMLKLFQTDFESIGGRFLPIVFIDVLLGECSSSGGIKLGGTGSWLPSARQNLVRKGKGDSLSALISEFRAPSSKARIHCLQAIRTLSHGNIDSCQTTIETLINEAWKNAASNQFRGELIQVIEMFLSSPYHARALRNVNYTTRNSLLSFIKTLKSLDPLPLVDPNLLVALASTHGLWYEVMALLEHQYRVLSMMENVEKDTIEELRACVRLCLRELGENDAFLTFSLKSCPLQSSKWAVSMDVHGMTASAIGAYTQLIDFVESSQSNELPYSHFEMDLWESRWVELQKDMCQLQVTKEYAVATSDPTLLLDTAWKNAEWDKVSGLVSSPSLVALMEKGDTRLKMSEIMVAIMEGKLTEVENLHAQTAQLCLQNWQLLPKATPASQCHSSLLHFFHRLVEFRESGQIMVETRSHSSRRTLPDLKNLLSAWRHRLPNDYERIADWDDIILWRSHMFNSITSHFSWSEAGTLATLHDREWTAIRMAKTARKQGLREVSLLALNKITDCAMDVSDAFSKLREQILTYYNLDSEMERTGGLNMVNTTNLSFFDAQQKSELFRLKAQFSSSLSSRSKANQAYCHAVQVCPTYARAWVSWGTLCSSLGRLAEKQSEQAKNSGDGNDGSGSSKKVAQYLAQAMGCYLEAIQCDTHEWCRVHLSRCLWMLSKDGSSSGVLCSTLEMRGATLPCWVWLPWCPQLLTSLYRCEGRAVKIILTGVAQAYPQSLYFPLRAFYLERRDVERSKGPVSTSASHSGKGSVSHSEELMSSLRRAHASLWSSLEAILEELIVKFRPSYEEELLATITALLERAESQCEMFSERRENTDEDSVVASISKTLAKISAKFFRVTPAESEKSKLDERAKKADAFKKRYKSLFEKDFLSNTKGSGKKTGLKEFLAQLKKWKAMLEDQVSATPLALPLVKSSSSLSLFSSDAPPLWAMSCDPKSAKAHFIRSERLRDDIPPGSSTSSSAKAARSTATKAAVAVADAAAHEGVGGEYGGGSACIEIPGQYAPNTGSSHDAKPFPELHSKLVRFEPTVRVVRRNDQLIRKIGMVGSDGKVYRFLLQFAIPYWTRTDERTSQLAYILDKVLRCDIMCSRKFLSIQPAPVIPIAQRLRMTRESDDRLSLCDAYNARCDSSHCPPNAVTSFYTNQLGKTLKTKNWDSLEKEQRKKTLEASKLEVFKTVCKDFDERILLDHVQSLLKSSENLYNFRRVFAGQLAANSLLQHALCVVLRTPSRFVINEGSGQVLAPEFRCCYNNLGKFIAFVAAGKVLFCF